MKAAVFMEMATQTKAIIPGETHPKGEERPLYFKLTKGVIFGLAITYGYVSYR